MVVVGTGVPVMLVDFHRYDILFIETPLLTLIKNFCHGQEIFKECMSMMCLFYQLILLYSKPSDDEIVMYI